MDGSLFPSEPPAPAPPHPRASYKLKAPPRRSDNAGVWREAEVEARVKKRILEYLARRGWKAHRLHCGRFKTLDGRLFWGEREGTPDRLFVRAWPSAAVL